MNTLKGGDSVVVRAAGLPEIQGSFRLNNSFGVVADDDDVSGAFSSGVKHSSGWEGNVGTFYDVNFNASRSSTIYGSSTTVQPPAISFMPQSHF